MVRTIWQDTYDEVVRENLEEFDMNAEEAIQDAVKQFQAQGVDLTNIIKDLAMVNDVDHQDISTSVKILDKLAKSKTTTDISNIRTELGKLTKQCDKGIPHWIVAGKERAYDSILSILNSYETERDVIVGCFKTLVSLMTGQPDLLQENGIAVIMKYLKLEERDLEVLHLILKWVRECCIKHEMNRQNIFNASILNELKDILHNVNAQILRDICAVLRALVLDDDVRVEFGKAPDHARVIAGDTLCHLVDQLTRYKNDEAVVSDLLLTLSAIIVRNEFCKQVDDAGGLDFVIEALNNFQMNENINRESLKLLKVLAGNDDCKARIIERGGAPATVNALSLHQGNAQAVTIGLNCIAAVTLRSPSNSKALFDAGRAGNNNYRHATASERCKRAQVSELGNPKYGIA